MKTEDIESQISNSINEWWTKLVARVEEIRRSGDKPVLVALSRKMPRLIDWLRDVYLPAHPELPSIDILDDCELTTELSIPLRVLECDMAKESYILIDDIIIHGTTVKNVASDLELLCDGLTGTKVKCYLSSIFLYNMPLALPSCVSTEDIKDLEPLKIENAKKVIARIAGYIRNSSLPLDMEYPIFRVAGLGASGRGALDRVAAYFKSIRPDDCYSSQDKTTLTMLFDRRDDSYEYDFAKLRCFGSGKRVSFEIFAPYILPDYLAPNSDRDIFATDTRQESENKSEDAAKGKIYNNLWGRVSMPMRQFVAINATVFNRAGGETLRRNMSRSLNVWANYLLSMSFMNEHCHKLLPDDLPGKPEINRSDLRLILGSAYCEKVIDDLKAIVEERIIGIPAVPSVSDSVEYFAPEPFVSDYRLEKAKLASHSKQVEDIAAGIFTFQNFSNPAYDTPFYRHERLFYGETFASLMKAASPYFTGHDTERAINRWIDDQIDNGGVVPKYEMYTTKEGYHRWRRYFHSGLNAANGFDEPVAAD